MPPIHHDNGFRKQRFTDAGGSDYTAIFRTEYSGSTLLDHLHENQTENVNENQNEGAV